MIVGTGVDLVETKRMADKILKDNGFKEKVFSVNEIAFCESMKEKVQHYAARFAAKEAFLKATGKGLTAGYELFEIEVIHTDSGKPEIKLSGNFHEQAIQQGWKKIHVSLTHVDSMASAVVIIEQ